MSRFTEARTNMQAGAGIVRRIKESRVAAEWWWNLSFIAFIFGAAVGAQGFGGFLIFVASALNMYASTCTERNSKGGRR